MKKLNVSRKEKCVLRHKRITKYLKNIDNKKPRLVVTRTNSHIYAQIVNDQNGTVLAAANTKQMKLTGTVANAKLVGEKIGELAATANILNVTFDRGGHKYHGQVKALADGAREKGLKI